MNSTWTPPIYDLGPDFYDEVEAAKFPQAILRYRNQDAAERVGLGQLSVQEWQDHFSAFKPLPGNLKAPLALRYHGHQFQHYNPDLGDGRGFLFAQFQADGKLLDLGTKGSGQTPYSRRGDGRLTLKGAFREILATELLESYGVNTSKTFSVFETGENLERHDEPSPTRAGVLVRLNHSHVRYGTFQRLAYFKQTENIKKLLDYCVKHFYPELAVYTEHELAASFLRAVAGRAADTAAGWMTAGFVHGVLNTDNMNITGESFDYGPYRFLPHYDPQFTAAYFDNQGLYAYGRQPTSVLWNLYQLGAALEAAFPQLPVEEILEEFSGTFTVAIHRNLLRRLNLRNPMESELAQAELNTDLTAYLFQFLQATKAPFEQALFDLHSGINSERLARSPQTKIYEHESFKKLSEAIESVEVADETKQQHEYFKQPKACSLLIDELEDIWLPIAQEDNWTKFEQKLDQIRSIRGLY
jgi:Uncharacterized conserved protein